jgi:hypothetical protein
MTLEISLALDHTSSRLDHACASLGQGNLCSAQQKSIQARTRNYHNFGALFLMVLVYFTGGSQLL